MANDIDVLTLEEAKTAISMSGSGQDEELPLWITAVSRRLDDLCGAVVTRTIEGQAFDGGKPWVDLDLAPVSRTAATTVTSVIEYDGTTATTLTADTNASQPAEAYRLDARLGMIYRRASGVDRRFVAGVGNVVVTYAPGRYATTAAVDERFKVAAGAILRRLWHREAGAWAKGGDPFAEAGVGTVGFFKAVDPMVREFLADELLPPAVA